MQRQRPHELAIGGRPAFSVTSEFCAQSTIDRQLRMHTELGAIIVAERRVSVFGVHMFVLRCDGSRVCTEDRFATQGDRLANGGNSGFQNTGCIAWRTYAAWIIVIESTQIIPGASAEAVWENDTSVPSDMILDSPKRKLDK